MKLAIEQLYDRYLFQAKKVAKNFSFLYLQGVWKDGEKLSAEENLADILKQGSLSIGFICLAEALVALTGKHHGESETSLQLGYEIVKR